MLFIFADDNLRPKAAIVDHSANQENKDPNAQLEDLDQEVLELIGKRLSDEKKVDIPIRQEVADRWLDILKQGLPADMRLDLIKKYPVPENCTMVNPPKLNLEVQARLTDPNKKRDDRILAKQAKLAAALAALAKVISAVLKSKDNTLLAYVNDAARLLVDLQRDESLIRRALVIANFNSPAAKEVLSATVPDDWLFGFDLAEKFKAAKALEAPLKALEPTPKVPAPKQPSATGSKNSKNPPRTKKSFQGGRVYRSNASKDGQGSSSRKRSPHRRTNSRRH